MSENDSENISFIKNANHNNVHIRNKNTKKIKNGHKNIITITIIYITIIMKFFKTFLFLPLFLLL